MAKSRKSPKNSATVTEFPQATATATPDEVPAEFQEAAEASPPTPTAPPTKPTPKKEPKIPTQGDFFARLAAIPAKEWDSQRIYLYLYILEPLVNLKQSGGKAYLNRYSQPVRDEHQVAVEYGSGRYRLVLAYNKVSPNESTEVARHEFEIYNLQYPPKVPKAAWINDSRNGKWEALLPKETPVTSTGTMVEAMKMYGEIRRDLKEELEPDYEPPTSSTNEVLQTMKAAKELFAPAATAVVQADPFDTAKKIMDMRGNDPMIAALMQRLDAADKAQEKAREREFELMKELRQTATTAAAPPKPFLEQLLEMATNDKLEPLKKVFGLFTGTDDGRPVRAGRTTAYDVVRDIASSPFGANLGQGLGMLLSNLATSAARQPQPVNGTHPQPQQQPAPVVLNQQQNNGTVPPAEDVEHRIQRVGALITQPMLYEFFLKDEPGDSFAETMFNMWPEDYVFMRALGAHNIIERYHQFPQAWGIIGPKEPAFVEFINEFCQWDPNEDGGPAPGQDDGVVDLDAKEATA